MAVVVLIVVLFIIVIAKRYGRTDNEGEPCSDAVCDSTTCGSTPTAGCAATCMMKAATEPIVYYDDEELDAFKGRDSNDYTDTEAELFAEVLETMHTEEADGWSRSVAWHKRSRPNKGRTAHDD